jgi:hypothetical protein
MFLVTIAKTQYGLFFLIIYFDSFFFPRARVHFGRRGFFDKLSTLRASIAGDSVGALRSHKLPPLC